MAVEPVPPALGGVRVFISYAHADEPLRKQLRTHLSALEREGLVHAWDDRQILGGENWAAEIDSKLEQADVVLLLVSADFIESDYCVGKEMKRALERNADPQDRAIVIPVILKRCDWETMRFAKLQALPAGARPLVDWKTEDDYYTAVAKGLRRRISKLRAPGEGLLQFVARRLRDPLWWQRPAVWATAVLVVAAAAGAGSLWWRAAVLADAEVASAVQALRSGRSSGAERALEPICHRLVSRDACFALAKARLGAELERPDELKLEDFAARVEALKAKAPDDPDLLLIGAELALRESRTDRHPQALLEIQRAIELAGGRYPEAHFYLANLNMFAGQFGDALPLLNLAIDANPVAPGHYLNARAFARAQRGDAAGAIDDYERSADLGLILSRIELAPLLWSRSAFEGAADQLSEARAALAAPPAGRNALPWVFETGEVQKLVLKQPGEKQCLAHWMERAGLALANRPGAGAAAEEANCGPRATEIRAAVASLLQRAIRNGMNKTGQQRAREFARQHNLELGASGAAR